jgi:hypothetical protein
MWVMLKGAASRWNAFLFDPVFCIVYRLYDGKGVRLSSEVAQANGVHGWLVYRNNHPKTGMPYCHADIFPNPDAPSHSMLLPTLRHATLRRCEGGMRFTGQEWNVDQRYFKQGWWAVPNQLSY